MISENLREVRQEIQKSCALVSSSSDQVTLVAVTKTVDLATTIQLVQEGIVHLAENRVDKFLLKKQAMVDFPQVNWHFIGNLQRRKVKSIVNEIDFLHSLDNLKLAAEIQKRATSKLKCFVEVNVSGEAAKQGIPPTAVLDFVEELAGYDKIEVVGLMTMAPQAASPVEQQQVFQRLAALRDEVVAKHPLTTCTQLSMGMSNDYQEAIKAGATYVRIGSALFKEG